MRLVDEHGKEIEIKQASASASLEEVADYAERAVDFFLSVGAGEKRYFTDACQAIYMIATIALTLLNHRGGLPRDGMVIFAQIDILQIAKTILSLKDWQPDPSFPWSVAEMQAGLYRQYYGVLVPMKLEIPEIAKLARQVTKLDPILEAKK